MKKKKRRNLKKIGSFLSCLVFLLVTIFCLWLIYFSPIEILPPKTAEDFNIAEIKSATDGDQDGIDDYTDLYLSAREYVETNPKYKSAYYAGGYPTDNYAVCTDVIWAAFKGAGYSLKDLVDADIATYPEAYPTIEEADPNIDFRRVKNLDIFFARHANSLTISLDDPSQWQAGDIVVYTNHIAICSSYRNKEGLPYILHHGVRGAREADNIRYRTAIVGHYRWTK